jgi:hypothetical protein
MIDRKLKRPLIELYEADETAWLEEMASIVADGRFQEMDSDHLAEFLRDMARRDKREVRSRLAVLLAHLLKWDHQPEQRTQSWQTTIDVQRDELEDLLESETLHQYAEKSLDRAYERAVRHASGETGLHASAFPAECPYSLSQITARP